MATIPALDARTGGVEPRDRVQSGTACPRLHMQVRWHSRLTGDVPAGLNPDNRRLEGRDAATRVVGLDLGTRNDQDQARQQASNEGVSVGPGDPHRYTDIRWPRGGSSRRRSRPFSPGQEVAVG